MYVAGITKPHTPCESDVAVCRRGLDLRGPNLSTSSLGPAGSDQQQDQQPAQGAAAGEPYLLTTGPDTESEPASMHSAEATTYSEHLPLFCAEAFRIFFKSCAHPALVCARPCPSFSSTQVGLS